MVSLAVILSLCTVVAVGIVYFFTDNLILSLLVLAVGLLLAFYLDKKWRLDAAKSKLADQDAEHRKAILNDLEQLRAHRDYVKRQGDEALYHTLHNIYDVSHHLLHDEDVDLKFVHQVGLYLPRINKIMDTYLSRSADQAFKAQSREFMMRTSEVFTRLLTASGNRDVKEAESLMQALDETYRSHGHIKKNDGGNLS